MGQCNSDGGDATADGGGATTSDEATQLHGGNAMAENDGGNTTAVNDGGNATADGGNATVDDEATCG